MILNTNKINNTTASTITAGNAASITTLKAAPIITPIIPINNAASIATTIQKHEDLHFLPLQFVPSYASSQLYLIFISSIMFFETPFLLGLIYYINLIKKS